MRIKIMLVDDHPLIREGVKSILETENQFTVINECDNANMAIEQINRNMPDVILTDIMLSNSINGIDLTKAISQRFPQIKSIIISMLNDKIMIEDAIKAGARGYILKKDASRNIISAVKQVYKGECFFSKDVQAQIDNLPINNQTQDSGINILSRKERLIYLKIGDAKSSREIAKELNIAISTVNTHKENIKRKLNIDDSNKLAQSAVAYQLSLTGK